MLLLSLIIFFLSIIFVTLEFTTICETRSDEECYEKNKQCINEDVKKNAVRRKQGKVSTRAAISFCYKLDFG